MILLKIFLTVTLMQKTQPRLVTVSVILFQAIIPQKKGGTLYSNEGRKRKSAKRHRSPLPGFDENGPTFVSNDGGFNGNHSDVSINNSLEKFAYIYISTNLQIGKKTEAFSKILWKKCALQLHVNDVIFSGDDTLPEEMSSLTTPTEFVMYFFDNNFMDHGSNWTNLRAAQVNIGTTFKTNSTEIKQLIGILIYMSLYKYPNTKKYWSKNRFDRVADAMTSKQFFAIIKYLAFNDYFEIPKKGDNL